MYFAIYFLIRKEYWFAPLRKQQLLLTSKKRIIISTLILVHLIAFGFRDILYVEQFPENKLTIPGKYTHEAKTFGVQKLTKKDVLIYIKPPVKPYQLEHSPTICWQGSGFKFHQIEERLFHGTDIYFGTLKSETKTMYTAWFFDNGEIATIDPFKWRWLALNGAPGFSLVNITASSPEKLTKELELWVNN